MTLGSRIMLALLYQEVKGNTRRWPVQFLCDTELGRFQLQLLPQDRIRIRLARVEPLD